MNSKVQEAVAELSKLSEAEQEVAAEAILDFARADRLEITDEQAAEVQRRLRDPNPKFLTLAEVRALLHSEL
jgi:hypothetical protein